MSGTSSINDHLFISPLKIQTKDSELEQELHMVKMENEQYKDKI